MPPLLAKRGSCAVRATVAVEREPRPVGKAGRGSEPPCRRWRSAQPVGEGSIAAVVGGAEELRHPRYCAGGEGAAPGGEGWKGI